jgi:tetratricopeptide (TPR) repeat protein
LEKAVSAYQFWQQTYPRVAAPYSGLGVVYRWLGNSQRALEEHLEAMRLAPDVAVAYQNLGADYVNLNRLDEAEEVYKLAEDRKLEFQGHTRSRYLLAFLKGDTAKMAQLASSATGRPGVENAMLATRADTEAWYGRLKNARELSRQAMESAQRNDAIENAAGYQAEEALFEADMGNREQARADADAAMKLDPARDVRKIAALAMARAGDTAAAQKLADQLDKAYPLDTRIQRYWLPSIRAAIALRHKDPNHAVELLQVATHIELGEPRMLAVYLRGEAYLMLHDGNHAAAEFQKYIDYRSIVRNYPWGPLGRLGLARAYAMQGDTTKAKAAYRDFLAIWKDANPDVPILLHAKAEYAKLQ